MPAVNRCYVETMGDGMPIVFLHGYPLNRSMWRKQAIALQNQYQVVLIDLPGFGDAPAATSNDFANIAQLADEVAIALHDIPIAQPVILVGLSMGGYIALEFWKRHRKWLRGLVLANTKALADLPAAIENRKKTAELAITQGTQVAVESMLQKVVGPSSQQDAGLMQWLRETMFQTSPQTIEMALLAMAARDDFTSHLHEIAIPTLVIGGEHDGLTAPEVMQSMASGIPTASFHAIPNAGHLSPCEQPQVFNQLLLDYLQTG